MISFIKNLMKKKYSDDYADFSQYGKGQIYDWQVAEFAMKHLKPWDWLNPYKIANAMDVSFTCLYEQEMHDADPEKEWRTLFNK